METEGNLADDTVEALKDLIEINTDSYKGFDQAAESVDDPRLTSFFKQSADERRRQVQVLRNHLPSYKSEGSFKGKMHRWWLDIRSKVQGGEAHAVLAEAERGEDEIKARYEKLLKEVPGSPLNAELNRQYAEVKTRHDLVRNLRDSYA